MQVREMIDAICRCLPSKPHRDALALEATLKALKIVYIRLSPANDPRIDSYSTEFIRQALNLFCQDDKEDWVQNIRKVWLAN